jgi:hypothetical protein
MADGAHTHHCPYCELKFLYINEVRDHVITDHPAHAAAFVTVMPREAEPHPQHDSA